MTREKTYKEQTQKIRRHYDYDLISHHVKFPAYLKEEWQKRRKAGLAGKMSEVIWLAMNFALFGPHPYDDPADGLRDAFRLYERRNFNEKEMVKSFIEHLADIHGIGVRLEDR